MRQLAIILSFALFNSISLAQTSSGYGVRILLGITDQQPAQWDGSAAARGAEVRSIEPWRFDREDSITGTSWKVSTHPARLFNGGAQLGFAHAPVVPNGVIVRLSREAPEIELAVKTAQGDFTIRLSEIPYGKQALALNGRVRIDLVPPVEQITNDPQEQDLPAASVAPNGDVWLAYLEFIHNPDHDKLRANRSTAPADFTEFTASSGGDHILARTFHNNAWSAPIEISASVGDVYRPAIAVDRSGHAWVFWPQNDHGNFHLWARSIENGRAGNAIRISGDSGVDMDPVAATDSAGRVWVAWQAWRNGRASIQYAFRNGAQFSAPKAIAPAGGNQWDPAIAADSSGRVTVAWDTYENGNYDVMMRTAVNGAWGKVSAVAATPRYEAYPSIAYDPVGRLWAAYEEGAEQWGKDFGAYNTTGIALYQGRAIRLRGFDREGRVLKTAEDPGAAIGGPMSFREEGRQNDSEAWLINDPKRSTDRKPSRGAANVEAPKNTLPRLAIDPSGRMWLAYRTATPIWWNALGTVWFENLVSYDGAHWSGPVHLTHSDNLLDNRPAVVPTGAGNAMIVASSDSRANVQLAFANGARETSTGLSTLLTMPTRDPYNNDLYATLLSLPPANGPMATVPAPPVGAPVITPDVKAERDAIARMRAYRIPYEGKPLHLARGEFHRHSETSLDGGEDGTLLDQWRYIIDTGALDWVGCCDHDNGYGREYTWWLTQKQTDLFYAPGHFSPLFSYERSVSYPEGHRNVLFAQRGVRVLPRLPKVDDNSTGPAPDTQMLFRYLKHFNGVVASHTSATQMGTDWRDNDPEVETSVEVFQGDRQNYEKPGAPRSSTDKDSIGGYRPKGYIDRALEMGYKLAFEASSDHVSTHMSFATVLTAEITREAIMDAFRKRHVYGATDNILADFRAGDHIMGDSFTASGSPSFEVHLAGTASFAKVVIVKDNQYVYSQEPRTAEVNFKWRDMSPQKGKTSYYYIRGEQSNGEIVWASPIWIKYE